MRRPLLKSIINFIISSIVTVFIMSINQSFIESTGLAKALSGFVIIPLQSFLFLICIITMIGGLIASIRSIMTYNRKIRITGIVMTILTTALTALVVYNGVIFIQQIF